MYTKAGEELEKQIFLESIEELKRARIPFTLIQDMLSSQQE